MIEAAKRAKPRRGVARKSIKGRLMNKTIECGKWEPVKRGGERNGAKELDLELGI